MAKTSGLSSADLRLWAAYGETLKLLPGKSRLPVEPEPAPGVAVTPVETPVVKPKIRSQAAQVRVDTPPPGLDRASWQKFRAGQTRAVRTLDLHGMTATRAHRATTQFIEQAHAGHLRVVEIITGKGEVLLRELPHWLNSPQLRPLILALAHPHAANTGSVRILLRRIR